jgi:hypothetical protein
VNGTYPSHTLFIYAPPYSGAPARTMSLQGYSSVCTLGAGEGRIFCADNDHASIDVYQYRSGKYLYSYDNGLTGEFYGIATAPAARN